MEFRFRSLIFEFALIFATLSTPQFAIYKDSFGANYGMRAVVSSEGLHPRRRAQMVLFFGDVVPRGCILLPDLDKVRRFVEIDMP